ncbi:Hint domain-containing protein [Thalassococcus sp. CAU 1522]|uniref:Hint domain-containing protein n=1 Tax=Thalassococcus arenae TaxID=2851652 RepID=A0ABS6N6P3_9RHOB|nr:Hint domain-containing protein [Thalassococcus arenae]MBV2359686.1 Hint domain-containing protein [Thalassococcus arenae]
MSWIAIAAGNTAWTDPRLFAPDLPPRPRLLSRGSLMLETRLSPHGKPQTLLAMERCHPWPGALTVQALPSGGVVLVIRQGETVFHTALDYAPESRTDTLRMTFSWDSEARFARLALERPDSDEVALRTMKAPPPLLLEDVETMVRRPHNRSVDADVVFFAFSDIIEPVGPQASLVPSSLIETPDGHRRLGDLRCGDLVLTYSGTAVPVLHRVERVVPALGSFRPIRLRAPYLGLTRDLVVAAHQRLVIGGSDVEYTFGREAVLVPAYALANGFAAVEEEGHISVRYAHLLLPGHEAPIVSGVAVESLYAGRIRRSEDRLKDSLLKDCPRSLLPEHARKGLQVLRPFEAMTLAEARAA